MAVITLQYWLDMNMENCHTRNAHSCNYRKTPVISTYVFSGFVMVQVLFSGAVLTFRGGGGGGGGYDKAE